MTNLAKNVFCNLMKHKYLMTFLGNNILNPFCTQMILELRMVLLKYLSTAFFIQSENGCNLQKVGLHIILSWIHCFIIFQYNNSSITIGSRSSTYDLMQHFSSSVMHYIHESKQ